jgi:hypothetical protein
MFYLKMRTIQNEVGCQCFMCTEKLQEYCGIDGAVAVGRRLAQKGIMPPQKPLNIDFFNLSHQYRRIAYFYTSL